MYAGVIAFTAPLIFKTVYGRQSRPEFFYIGPYASKLIIESISYLNLTLAFLIFLCFKKMFFSGRAHRFIDPRLKPRIKKYVAGCTLLGDLPHKIIILLHETYCKFFCAALKHKKGLFTIPQDF